MARILIVDDHPLFREALQSALNTADQTIETVDATDVKSAVACLEADSDFDLILLDLNIPEVKGFEGLLMIRCLFPRLPVAIVSGHEDHKVIFEALSYGASGFIPKSVKRAELTRAIHQILEGSIYVPFEYSPPEAATEANDRRQMIARLATLTPQQIRVLQMLREGLLNKQIAFELHVGETTVKAHVSEILRKLSVYSRTQAVIEVSKLDATELMHLGETLP